MFANLLRIVNVPTVCHIMHYLQNLIALTTSVYTPGKSTAKDHVDTKLARSRDLHVSVIAIVAIVSNCPGVARIVPEFGPMSWLCPELPDLAAMSGIQCDCTNGGVAQG